MWWIVQKYRKRRKRGSQKINSFQSSTKFYFCFCRSLMRMNNFSFSCLHADLKHLLIQGFKQIAFCSISYFSAFSQNHTVTIHVMSTAVGLYLKEAVHVGLHVGDGHPLHYDVRDPSFQRLPFVASHSGGVNANCTPVRRTAHTCKHLKWDSERM